MFRQELAIFAGEIAHELRTPLSVIFGDVDLALARERSSAAYREALARIAERLAVLIDLTDDLATMADAGDLAELRATANLETVFAGLSERYGPRRGMPVTFEAASCPLDVAGDEMLMVRALSLLVEHALRHRREGSRVRLRALQNDGAKASTTCDLVLDAAPAGFSSVAWHALSSGTRASQPADGQFRLQTAERIITGCGGSLTLASEGGAECVRIHLEPAAGLAYTAVETR